MPASVPSTFPGVFPGAEAYVDHDRPVSWGERSPWVVWGVLLALVTGLIWSFWPTFEITATTWNQPQYSHGWIVPLIALYLLWQRRPNPVASPLLDRALAASFAAGGALVGLGMWQGVPLLQGLGVSVVYLGVLAAALYQQPLGRAAALELWAGLAVVLLGTALRAYAAYYDRFTLLRYAFLITLAGAFLSVGGVRLLKWAGVSIAFLVFMFPLPTVVESNVLLRLQRLAAIASEAGFVVMGVPVSRSGNRLELPNAPLDIAEACSGLSMSTIFFAMAIATVVLMQRPWWDKLIVLLSAVPIALAVNVARIIVTGYLLMKFPHGEVLHKVIHDWSGLVVMMPLALGLLYLELKVLRSLTVDQEEADSEPAIIGRGGAVRMP